MAISTFKFSEILLLTRSDEQIETYKMMCVCVYVCVRGGWTCVCVMGSACMWGVCVCVAVCVEQSSRPRIKSAVYQALTWLWSEQCSDFVVIHTYYL